MSVEATGSGEPGKTTSEVGATRGALSCSGPWKWRCVIKMPNTTTMTSSGCLDVTRYAEESMASVGDRGAIGGCQRFAF